MVSALAEIRRCAQLNKYLEGQSSKSSQAKSVMDKCFSAKLAKVSHEILFIQVNICIDRFEYCKYVI